MSRSRSRLVRAEHRLDLPATSHWLEPETSRLRAEAHLVPAESPPDFLAARRMRAQLGWPR